MISLSSEVSEPFVIHSGFNQMVDFCVWILERDGLKVPPFSHHPEGSAELREQGLNSANWSIWFERIIRTQDQRLNWHVPNIQDSISQKQESFKRMAAEVAKLNIKTPERSESKDRVNLERILTWEEQQYQRAIALSGGISNNYSDPSSLWDSSEMVKPLLSQQWSIYQSQLRERAQILIGNLTANTQSIGRPTLFNQMYDEIRGFQDRPDALEILQVGYPHAIEYVLSPVYIVVSLKNGLGHEESFCESILQATNHLISKNRSL
jgi:hypothetical protein